MTYRFLIVFLLFALGACATPQQALIHQRLKDGAGPVLTQKMLVISPDVRVSELSAGGVVEEVPDWTRQANGHMRSAFTAIARQAGISTVDLPKLDPAQQELLEQHVALYDLVAVNAFETGRSADPAWAHKRQAFDYTVGPGMAFLAEQSGAEEALFIVGTDVISSGGRQALMVVGALFGVSVPLGFSYLTAGVVDLKSGDLLWLNHAFDETTDLRQAKDTDTLLRRVFHNYPGTERGQGIAK